ncbi:MAG: deoxyribose-phosphate aldolase [Hadesarchaea archaeon]|nr:deoxyribose-phosphate aldolase [Hadesarchaea archaeon]
MVSPINSIVEIEKRVENIQISPEELASIIDHTELTPNKPASSIKKLCNEAEEYNFHAVCVNPFWTRFCVSELQDTDVRVDTVIGFPLGQTTPEEKVFEAEKAIEEGADEIDMVINIGVFRDEGYDFVKEEIESVVDTASGNIVKVILETGYLTYEEIPKACKIAKEAGADFVKNSTGFGPLGSTVPHIALMRESVGEEFGVKASGGISSFKDALRMIAAGADRLGSSSGVEIIDNYKWVKKTGWPSGETPCDLCPTHKATLEEMPKGVSQYYKEKCSSCEFKNHEE